MGDIVGVRVLVCGSRGWSDKDRIFRRLVEIANLTVIHGGAEGADRLADECARELPADVEVHPADWGQYGRAAGPIRNAAMLDTKPDLVIAFWDGRSPGTRNTILGALERRINVEVIFPR